MAEETAEQIADRVVQKWLLTRGADATQSGSLREPLGRAEGKKLPRRPRCEGGGGQSRPSR